MQSMTVIQQATTWAHHCRRGSQQCLALCAQIVLAPKWRTAYRALLSDLVFLPLALAYIILLVRSWQPDTLSLMMPGKLANGFAGRSFARRCRLLSLCR